MDSAGYHEADGRQAVEPELTPEQSLALIEAQRHATRRAVDVDDRLLYATWGVAWLIAYGVTWLVFRGTVDAEAAGRPAWLVNIVWPVAMFGALFVTARHVTASQRGIRQDGAHGLIYGLAFMLGIAAAGATGVIVMAEFSPTLEGPLVSVLPSAFIVLVIATIYMVSASIWSDWLQFGVGSWLLLANIGSLLLGGATYSLGMAIGGGGGFLLAAIIAGRRAAARSRAA